MKKKILLLMGVFAFGLLQAQVGVGINTTNPLGWLHVDPAGDTQQNAATGIISNDEDDVIVTTDGRVGIGTAELLAGVKLDIARDNIRIVDGSQGNGHILTSDDNGVGTWVPSDFQFLSRNINDGNAAGTPSNLGQRLPRSLQHARGIGNGAIQLNEGNWLVIAKYTSSHTDVTTYYSWVIILDAVLYGTLAASNSDVTPSFIAVSGAPPELSTPTVPAGIPQRIATPQISIIVNVPAGQTRTVGLAAASAAGPDNGVAADGVAYLTNYDLYGGGYFYAIKLSY